MGKCLFSLAVAGAILAPAPAIAQIESVDPDTLLNEAEGEPSVELGEKLADPAMQEQIATTVTVMSEILLDLPLAPLAKSLAEAGVESADRIPRDATLRKLAPGAERVPEELAENLPRMMNAMAALSKGLEEMRPALEEMADRMKEALPEHPYDER